MQNPAIYPDSQGPKPPRLGVRHAAAAFLLLLVCCLAAEFGYRLYWKGKCAFFSPQDKGEFFALYTVGESTAGGVPYSDTNFSPPYIVQRQFDGIINGKNMRLFFQAKGGASIYPQSVEFEQALRCRDRRNPGAVLIYASHNDEGKAVGISLFERFKNEVRRHSMLAGDMIYFLERKHLLPSERTMDTYEYHMRRVVELSLKSGLVPIPATGVSNLSGIDPAIGGDAGLTHAEIKEILEKGSDLEAGGGNLEALSYYLGEVKTRQPPFLPYLKYRAARCLQALGRYGEAEKYYEEAAEESPGDNFGRANVRQNAFILSLGARYGIPVVDAVKVFRAHSPHGIVGDSLFSDGHHPNIEGYILLSGSYAEKISETFREPVKRHFADRNAVSRDFTLGPERLAEAYVNSGKWYFAVSVWHPYPGQRLLLARKCFQNSLAVKPGNFGALLNLAMAEAALKSDMLSNEKEIEWLAKNFYFYSEPKPSNYSAERMRKIIVKLREHHIDEELLGQIADSYRKQVSSK